MTQRPTPVSSGNLLELQRLIGNAATTTLIQRWTEQGYQADQSARTLHVEQRNVLWGGTVGPNHHANHNDLNRQRGVLFETIGRESGWAQVAPRLVNGPMWDIGLTIVLNQAYTPPKVYDGQNGITSRNHGVADAFNLTQAKQILDQRWNNVSANWQGPSLQMVTAAWERRARDMGGNGDVKLEAAQSSVPYTTLRVLAASNPGADAIEAALRSNHSEFWRKMGDDDMPIFDPNANTPEMQKLQEVEDSGVGTHTNVIVTFGYNLTTAGTQPPITGILQGLYRTEMELRDQIALAGGPMYPSEPTTFYRPRAQGSMNVAWQRVDGEQTGGSGQQLEGAKLARALKTQGAGGFQHKVFHTVMVDTSAAARNNEIVNLLNGWYAGGQGDPTQIREADLEAAINNLDQSALRHDEYSAKVLRNLKIELHPNIFRTIETLVVQYRQRAVREACEALRADLMPGHRTRVLWPAYHARTAQERQLKWA